MMFRRSSYAITGALLVLASLGAWRAAPADAATGDTPDEAEFISYAGYTVYAWLEPGQRRWYQLPYPGNGAPIGITLHLRPEDADIRDAVSLSVNVRIAPEEFRGERNAEWQGYGRIGFASISENTRSDRKFWFNNFGRGETYYLLVRNGSSRRIPIAISVRPTPDPWPYLLMTADVPAPTPVPSPHNPTPAPALRPEMTEAVAELVDTDGNAVGFARLTQEADGVRIEVVATGLTPGLHGVQLHPVGACEPPPVTSADGPIDSNARARGLENPDGPQAVDLPEFLADGDGDAVFEVTTDRVTLSPGTYSLLDHDGSAPVIYAPADDHPTDPAGGAGDRVVCGVIVGR